ncbi:MAG: DUF1385 domain-containing protein [Myxococcales bacterium]|nr:DUF1385 domain-containing protein [Myxococcales bacterium]
MNNPTKPYIGGQAVIEGVMMRAPSCLAIAVRRPDQSIALREGPFRSALTGRRAFKLPGLRGVATLVESLKMGFGALRFSAEQQMSEEERAQEAEATGKGAVLISSLLAIGLFIALPQLLASGSGKLLGFELGLSDASFHLLIGGFKLLVFLTYVLVIRRIPEVARVFQYHGAEHKTIHAYEQRLPLTVENVRAQTTLHPRCGTTFLVMVVIVSILFGSLAAPLFLPNAEGLLGHLSIFVLRLALLPFIAALSFEIQRIGARFCTRGPLRVFLWPGFLFQMITTKEPDDSQIEIAIAAMKAAEWRESVGATIPADDEPLVFGSFDGFVEALPALREALAPPATRLG